MINGKCQSQSAMKCKSVDNRTICYECESSYYFDDEGDCKMNSDVYCLSEKDGDCYMCSTTMIEPYQCEQKSADDGLKGEVIDDLSDSDNNDDYDDEHIPYKISCNMNSAVGCLRCNPGYYVDGMECKKCK